MNKKLTYVIGLVLLVAIVVVVLGLTATNQKASIFSINKKEAIKALPSGSSQKFLYKDASSGTMFEYPSNLRLEVKVSANTDLSQPYCPTHVWVRLSQPGGKQLRFDPSAPWMDPFIDIMVHKANCSADVQENLSTNQSQLQQSLSSTRLAAAIKSSMVALVPVVGDYPNGPNQSPIWGDQCRQSFAGNAKNPFIVTGTKCVLDGGLVQYFPSDGPRAFFQTKKFLPVGNSIVVQASYGEESFSDSIVNGILNSFKVMKIVAPTHSNISQ